MRIIKGSYSVRGQNTRLTKLNKMVFDHIILNMHSGWLKQYYSSVLCYNNVSNVNNEYNRHTSYLITNTSTTGSDYILYLHIENQLLNMLRIKRDINQQDF